MEEGSVIRILHYHNPYFIWVEIKSHDTWNLQQIGVFGLVPWQIDMLDGITVHTESDRWDSRANAVVDKFFKSKHLFFKCILRYIQDQNQSSIFKNQPHLFGEIYSVKKQDGVKKYLSDRLDKTIYASKNISEFFQMVSERKIKTKLDDADENDVLHKILKMYQANDYWQTKKEVFLKHLTPAQLAKLQIKPESLMSDDRNLEKAGAGSSMADDFDVSMIAEFDELNGKSIEGASSRTHRNDKASHKTTTEGRLVACGPNMNDEQSLVRDLVLVKIDESLPKVVDSTNFTWEKGNVWENNSQDFNDPKSHGQKSDLNDSQICKDFVKIKQDRVKSRSDNVDKKKTGRRRYLRFNESASSIDNHVAQKTSSTDGNSKAAPDSCDSLLTLDGDLEEIHAKLRSKYQPITIKNTPDQQETYTENEKPNTNLYKNTLLNSSCNFVEPLSEPLLLVHTKNNDKIVPEIECGNIPFKSNVHNTLLSMGVRAPLPIQSVSWPYILKGHSMFIISPPNSGKSVGFLPAVCNLVLDYNFDFLGTGPILIIVCPTAISVENTVDLCKKFLIHERVVASFPGINIVNLVTNLMNGCAVLVSTPSLLCKLLDMKYGVDLQRLTTLVFEDCERLEHTYELEVKTIHLHVKAMLKSRSQKQVKVQYVLASRKWCNFMESNFGIVKNVPDTIVIFAALNECVVYSKTQTSFSYVEENKKVDSVLEFLKETDRSKLTVIVCSSDDEVNLLELSLRRLNCAVVAINNQMTEKDLFKIQIEKFSSILICCDPILQQLNVTYANYLLHFAMPETYTQFCKRFAVLNDNYASIFGPANKDVKIKILLDETNTGQLPKTLQFLERCSIKVPEGLQEIACKALAQNELEKAERLVNLCQNMLVFGECFDYNMYTCKDRHAILKGYDEPKSWMPCKGDISFQIIHYHSAAFYSARILSQMTENERTEYPQTHTSIYIKLKMLFRNQENKRVLSEPKVGDICAVDVGNSFISRCQVIQIDYKNGLPKSVLINLIDEEMMKIVSAEKLYFLPDQLKGVEPYVARVCLANVKPLDNDLTFSELAMNELMKITKDNDHLYLKGKVVMTIGNTIFISSIKAYAKLSALCETVIEYDFMKMLDTHAVPNPDHLLKLKTLCDIGNLKVRSNGYDL